MREEINNLKNEAIAQIMESQSAEEVANLKIVYLGRKGKLNLLIDRLKDLPPTDKKDMGQLINSCKETIDNLITERHFSIIKNLTEKREWFDLTIPGKKPSVGNLHPLTTVLTEVIGVFNKLGYQIADGPEIETDYYNFEALNIPKDHPARDTQQTFWLDTKGTNLNPGEIILRTQTSAMQGRVMEKMKPPFKVLVPGKCFRYEQVDASHGFEFWQVEGFVVDENIHLTDLFGTINFVLKEIFGPQAETKFATTNFPFVEPGVDTYLKCTICEGKGCSFCKNTGWSEIMPAGMIHPNVLKMAKIDSTKWSGFAFAIGLSRIVNLKYQIKDLRVLTNSDLRVLKQFK